MQLSDLMAIIGRQWVLILLVPAIVTSITWYQARSIEPTYTSNASVTLRTYENQALFPSVSVLVRDQFIRVPMSELEFVRSDLFRSIVDADPSLPPVTVSAPIDSNQLEFRSTSTDPEATQRAVNRWADAYVAGRAELAAADIVSSLASTEELIANLEAQKATIIAPLKPIDDAIETGEDPDLLTRLTAQRLTIRQSLEDDLRPIENQLYALNESKSQLSIANEYLQSDGISARVTSVGNVGTRTGVPTERLVFAGLALGALLGLGLGILRDSLRGLVNDSGDVAAIAPHLPILAYLPDHQRRGGRPHVSPLGESSPFSEGVESLVTSLGLIMRGTTGNRFLFTSPHSADGKTTLVANVASRLAWQGVDVIAVDADLRRPNLTAAFGLPHEAPGVSSILLGTAEISSALLTPDFNMPLDVLPAGPVHENPAALLRSGLASTLFEKLGNEAGIVVIDSAPCLPVTDTVVLAALSADHVILLARAGRTRRRDLAAAIETMSSTEVQIDGLVLMGGKRQRGYETYYADQSGRHRKSKGRRRPRTK